MILYHPEILLKGTVYQRLFSTLWFNSLYPKCAKLPDIFGKYKNYLHDCEAKALTMVCLAQRSTTLEVFQAVAISKCVISCLTILWKHDLAYTHNMEHIHRNV